MIFLESFKYPGLYPRPIRGAAHPSIIMQYSQMQVQETKQVYACQETCLVKKGTAVSVTIDKTTVKQYEEFSVTCRYWSVIGCCQVTLSTGL